MVAKAADEEGSSLLTTNGNISRFFVASTPSSQPELPPNRSEGGDRGKDISEDIFQLQVWSRKNKPDLQSERGSTLTLRLGY